MKAALFVFAILFLGLPWWLRGEESSSVQVMRFRSLHGEDPLEKAMTAHSSVLAWKIPWTVESGGLQTVGSQKSQAQLSD